MGLAGFCIFLTAPLRTFGETVVFEQITGENRVIYENTRAKTPEGFRITVTSPGEFNECELNPDLSVVSWIIKRPAAGVEVAFDRIGDRIYAKGRVNDKAFEETYKVGDEPWYQFHELCLDTFATSAAMITRFWTIDRRDMRIVKFKAEKIGREPVEAAGEVWDAIRVKISLTGLARLLRWQSTAWLRENDGRYLKLEAPGISSSDEDSVVRLIEESE